MTLKSLFPFFVFPFFTLIYIATTLFFIFLYAYSKISLSLIISSRHCLQFYPMYKSILDLSLRCRKYESRSIIEFTTDDHPIIYSSTRDKKEDVTELDDARFDRRKIDITRLNQILLLRGKSQTVMIVFFFLYKRISSSWLLLRSNRFLIDRN